MKSFGSALAACFTALVATTASAERIADINGQRFISPLRNQQVTNVTGLVTAKGPNGIFLRSTQPDTDARTSDSIYVFSNSIGRNLTVGDIIQVGGKVEEYRSSVDYLFLTEITSPRVTSVISRGNPVTPKVIGKDTLSPPTERLAVDRGDVFSLPNNVSLISVENPFLNPYDLGLDFWESLSGELVTIKGARAVAKPNQYGDTWVVGDWRVSGANSRGGLTLRDRDANPEAIIIGSPLDNSKNPTGTKLGDSLADITGVVTYAFGFYRILPLTAIKVTGSASPALPPPTTLTSTGNCKGITVGSYNIENLAPTVAWLPQIASHIAVYMKSPDIMFVQEVQDNNGPTNDAVVDANVTLSTLTAAIVAAGGVQYEYVDIDPIDDQDGGQPGGNIRTAYLYNPSVLRLKAPIAPGCSTCANEVITTSSGLTLKYNPGRIDPLNDAAWSASRKPLVAAWETVADNQTIFTVNVHFTSKGGGTSLHGDARPPVNGGVDQRVTQARVTGDFISKILYADSRSAIITSGDFNEFAFVEPLEVFVYTSGLRDLDVAAGIPEVERYTYLFDANSQQLDHTYVSPAVAGRSPKYEHVHINTWADADGEASDHDPSVALLNVCR